MLSVKFHIFLAIFLFVNFASANIKYVKNLAELEEALKNVHQGDTIKLADGLYSGNVKISLPRQSYQDINYTTIIGSPNAIFENRVNSEPVFNITNTTNIKLHGFTIQNAVIGIDILDTKVLVDGVTIQNIDKVGIRVDNIVDPFIITKSTLKNIGTPTDGGVGLFLSEIALIYEEYLAANITLGSLGYLNVVTIDGNNFGPGITGVAIEDGGSKELLLFSNTFYGAGRDAKLAEGKGCWLDSKAEKNNLLENVGIGCEGDGFLVRTCKICRNDFIKNTCYFKLEEDGTDLGELCIHVIPEEEKSYGFTKVDISNIAEGGKNLTNVPDSTVYFKMVKYNYAEYAFVTYNTTKDLSSNFNLTESYDTENDDSLKDSYNY